MMLQDGADIGREDAVGEVFRGGIGVATSVDQLCRGCAVELCRGVCGSEGGAYRMVMWMWVCRRFCSGMSQGFGLGMDSKNFYIT